MGRFAHERYVELAMHFGCNLRCEHCLLGQLMDRLEPEPLERFDELLGGNGSQRRWTALTLTGAEITLRRDLADLARKARGSGFEHVRIQTNGVRLADAAYCRHLVEAGVDEYYVSVVAPDAAVHDAATGVPGSWDKTLRCLENLDTFPEVTTITNTVITRRSYSHLPGLVRRLGHLRRLAQMEFWGYWPMTEDDERDLAVSHFDVLPYLREAIVAARQRGRTVEVKNFPECLLGEFRDALDNGQPALLIDPGFWPEFQRNGFYQCAHRAACGAVQCLGLNTAYARKFGWQTERLVPIGGGST